MQILGPSCPSFSGNGHWACTYFIAVLTIGWKYFWRGIHIFGNYHWDHIIPNSSKLLLLVWAQNIVVSPRSLRLGISANSKSFQPNIIIIIQRTIQDRFFVHSPTARVPVSIIFHAQASSKTSKPLQLLLQSHLYFYLNFCYKFYHEHLFIHWQKYRYMKIIPPSKDISPCCCWVAKKLGILLVSKKIL